MFVLFIEYYEYYGYIDNIGFVMLYLFFVLCINVEINIYCCVL